MQEKNKLYQRVLTVIEAMGQKVGQGDDNPDTLPVLPRGRKRQMIDEIDGIIWTALEACDKDGNVTMKLKSGGRLQGKLPPGVTPADALRLAGKCLRARTHVLTQTYTYV